MLMQFPWQIVRQRLAQVDASDKNVVHMSQAEREPIKSQYSRMWSIWGIAHTTFTMFVSYRVKIFVDPSRLQLEKQNKKMKRKYKNVNSCCWRCCRGNYCCYYWLWLSAGRRHWPSSLGQVQVALLLGQEPRSVGWRPWHDSSVELIPHVYKG